MELKQLKEIDLLYIIKTRHGKILEIQKTVKAIVRKHENNLIKLNIEVFRSIDGYGSYAISSFGNVKNVKTSRILKTQKIDMVIFQLSYTMMV